MNDLEAEIRVNTPSLLGEGPVWFDMALWWVDIEGKRLLSWDGHAEEPGSFDLPERIGFAVPTKRGDWLLGLQSGIHSWTPGIGEPKRLAAPEAEERHSRFNDGKCDPQGRLWAGTMSMNEITGMAALYRMDSRKSITRALGEITTSNGLSWDPDTSTMYYIDSPTRRVSAFRFDPQSGEIRDRRTVYRVPDGKGFPDGMAIDSKGTLWIALWGGASVLNLDPASGAILRTVKVPARNVTSCAFGGDDLETLFITSASIGLTDDEKQAFPHSGKVFSVRPGARGLPTVPFRD